MLGEQLNLSLRGIEESAIKRIKKEYAGIQTANINLLVESAVKLVTTDYCNPYPNYGCATREKDSSGNVLFGHVEGKQYKKQCHFRELCKGKSQQLSLYNQFTDVKHLLVQHYRKLRIC